MNGMYREIVEKKFFLRIKKGEVIKKINELEDAGVDYNDLIYAAIMAADTEKLLEKKKKKLVCV